MIVIPAYEKSSDAANIEAKKETVLAKELKSNVTENLVDFNTLMQVVMDYEKRKGGVVFSCDGYTAQVIINNDLIDDAPHRFIRYLAEKPSKNLKGVYAGMGFVEDPDFSKSIKTMKDLMGG